MKLKTLAVSAALALAAVTAVTAGAAPASAAQPSSACEFHLDTVLGGVCIPIP